MSGVSKRARRRRACSSVSARRIPFSSARRVDSWITGPSARGSLKGTPSSRRSHPSSQSAASRRSDSAGSGKPDVRKGTKARRRSVAARSERKLLLVVGHAQQAMDARILGTQPGGVLEGEDRLIGGVLIVVGDAEVVVEP